MYKLLMTLVFCLFPALVLADSLSLTPPPGDYSVVFLGNLFGIVDGVLHGTGSQMMGVMFKVFNSAVLAIGGIVIIYTLIVSTMNTAHEGQMLGQKWSSIWIPVRSTLGLALLIPKASGYCMMQIFVMWVVVQGVGAADKVWSAALSYLNRGGVIIQAQASNPGTDLIAAMNSTTASSVLLKGATTILGGQLCMLGLQKELTAHRKLLIKQTDQNTGPCTDPQLKPFCDTPVPDFLNTVNVVSIQNQGLSKEPTGFTTKATYLSANMPTINSGPYAILDKICGTISWASVSTELKSQDIKSLITPDEYKTTQLSRAIAIQQMYSELSIIANAMISNNPLIGAEDESPSTETPAEPWARLQYGVPLTGSGTLCKSYSQVCTSWGPYKEGVGVLFNGTELQGALNDYNGIMMPTLKLLNTSVEWSAGGVDVTRQFVNEASAKGWMMAGMYFFDLVKINSNAVANSNPVGDTFSGLEKSSFNPQAILDRAGLAHPQLLIWYQGQTDVMRQKLSHVTDMIGGVDGSKLPDLNPNPSREVDDKLSSTLYGFINNSIMVQLPGQPGLKSLEFAKYLTFTPSPPPYDPIPDKIYTCAGDGYIYIGWPISDNFCYGQILGETFYNGLVLWVANKLLRWIWEAITSLLNIVLWLPLQGIADIFRQGVQIISKPGVNPIVALANMGVFYINFAGELWKTILMTTVVAAIAPPIFALIMLALPLIMAWVGVMLSIAIVTAYYVPILPFMIFTFGAIGWLITVIEAMVAAPLVALGITHPEGHDAFGKGEAAVMILMNVFLRPAMMIIGYIAAIALCYVGVWILNAGFDHAISYMQGGSSQQTFVFADNGTTASQGSGSGETKYNNWAGIFAFFFSILTYTTMYLVIVQKSFTLITHLPDKVLRWIGGSPESSGQEAAQWGEEVKSGTKEASSKATDAQQQIGKSAGAGAQKALSKIGGGGGGKPKTDATAKGSSTPSPSEDKPVGPG